MSRVCFLLVIFALTGSVWSAEPLGRFFFTPAERAELDALRHRKTPPPPPLRVAPPPTPTDAAVTVEAPPREPQVLTYRGIVKRSDGRSTVWLNDRPVDANEALAGLPVTGQIRPDGSMSLVDTHTGRRIDLKVGQSVELDPADAEARRAPRKPAPRTGAAAKDAGLTESERR
jgi:hypothetical protein